MTDNSGEIFRATYLPDYADLFQIQKIARRQHFTSGQRLIWKLFYLVYFLTIAVLAFWGTDMAHALAPQIGSDLAEAAPIVLMIVIGLLFYWLICIKLNHKLSAKWLKERKPPLPLTFFADDEGIKLQTEESQSFVKWRALERLFVTRDAVCFLYGASTIYVPKRAFANLDEVETFLQAAWRHLSPEAQKQSVAPSLTQHIAS